MVQGILLAVALTHMMLQQSTVCVLYTLPLTLCVWTVADDSDSVLSKNCISVITYSLCFVFIMRCVVSSWMGPHQIMFVTLSSHLNEVHCFCLVPDKMYILTESEKVLLWHKGSKVLFLICDHFLWCMFSSSMGYFTWKN